MWVYERPRRGGRAAERVDPYRPRTVPGPPPSPRHVPAYPGCCTRDGSYRSSAGPSNTYGPPIRTARASTPEVTYDAVATKPHDRVVRSARPTTSRGSTPLPAIQARETTNGHPASCSSRAGTTAAPVTTASVPGADARPPLPI
ncbi:hypothetical protein [Streptomyces sp. BF23-30]|uniref:hypothetical protein n=1 Tax=Streptomyces sp. BF23-30 TaxID=3240281 RepID=UPI0034E5F4CD